MELPCTSSRFGYTRVKISGWWDRAWEKPGYEIFSGVNVPSKAFGEFVEHNTARLAYQRGEKNKTRCGENIVILDSRPMKEFTP
ncbi:MAG: hypothetical protein CM1200mP18_21270 [Gammaproteobacteria bacterium]|nr:MAG: hypothetical protein CM1200mP18_21270 [Gammaproteobacteria bacterium]